MAKTNKGLRTYDGVEGLNASLGQAGFKVLTGGDNTGDGNFIAFQVIGEGVSLTTSGTPDSTQAGYSAITVTTHVGDGFTAKKIESGTTVYGPFKKITAGITVDAMILCYYG